ncbi:MAG: di-trans,poly-cis-decaprenylcistransferase [Bacteroidales bacterium]|nr:di-trans,poly-cis-decaprenylcistransferase [Bacteroidales bacterium]
MMNKIPRHVAIIMDGNGRWARQRGLDRVFGHREGVESVRAVFETSVELGIQYVSLFAFSEENWARPDSEVSALMSLFIKSINAERETLLKNGIHFRVLGNRARLSPELNEAIDSLDAATSAGTRMTVLIFVSYSGKWDIAQAARRMSADGGEDLEKYLVTAGVPDPDLLIRTSGEQRISNFMLWQIAYTELVFTDVLWPDFRREQYLAALEEYSLRDRRFGKVK